MSDPAHVEMCHNLTASDMTMGQLYTIQCLDHCICRGSYPIRHAQPFNLVLEHYIGGTKVVLVASTDYGRLTQINA